MIQVVGLPDGRVQLLHSYSTAQTTEDAEEGLLFMQEMVEISRSTSSQPDNPPRIVAFNTRRPDGSLAETVLKAGPAQFGLELKEDVKVTAGLVVGQPFRMCTDPADDGGMRQKIVIIQRGDCMFVEKVSSTCVQNPNQLLTTFFRFVLLRPVDCRKLVLLVASSSTTSRAAQRMQLRSLPCPEMEQKTFRLNTLNFFLSLLE